MVKAQCNSTKIMQTKSLKHFFSGYFNGVAATQYHTKDLCEPSKKQRTRWDSLLKKRNNLKVFGTLQRRMR